MLHSNQFMILMISFSVFWTTVSYDDFRFQRVIDCIQVDSKGICQDWNQTTTLYRYTTSIYFCFPGDSYVLTSKGPRQFKSLQLSDQLFGMNLQTGKNQFSSTTAWLHRDPNSLLDFSLIQLKNSNWKFIGSDYHNIAFSNENLTDFKFLKDLNPSDTLVSFSASGQNFIVQSIDKHEQKQGLFSPYTKTGTFYIYPENFSMEKYQQNHDEYPMILVHCLSQVANPTNNQHIVDKYVTVSSSILGSHQPHQEEEYVSPLLSTFSGLFGNDWVSVEGEKIAHMYSSSSSARNRQREERKRKTIAVIALETVLAHSLL